jgi:hypothetical protein
MNDRSGSENLWNVYLPMADRWARFLHSPGINYKVYSDTKPLTWFMHAFFNYRIPKFLKNPFKFMAFIQPPIRYFHTRWEIQSQAFASIAECFVTSLPKHLRTMAIASNMPIVLSNLYRSETSNGKYFTRAVLNNSHIKDNSPSLGYTYITLHKLDIPHWDANILYKKHYGWAATKIARSLGVTSVEINKCLDRWGITSKHNIITYIGDSNERKERNPEGLEQTAS